MTLLTRIQAALDLLRKEAVLANVAFLPLLWRASFLYFRTGLKPRYYVLAGMARDSFPQAHQSLHISATEYRQALGILNPADYRKLIQNKLLAKALYTVMHIPTPRMRGYYHPRKGITDYGQPLQREDHLEDLLGSLNEQDICLKPLEGQDGRGVIIGRVGIRQGQVVVEQPSNGALDVRAILASYRTSTTLPEFIVEDRVRQSGQLADFNPDSLNTLRLWVLADNEGKASVLGGYLGVGRTGSVIDNLPDDGLICPVDVESGILSPAITRVGPHRDELEAHPDHGAPLSGEQIEQWQTIRDFACEVLAKLPYTRFAALDIAVTPGGPVLVGANGAPDMQDAAWANIPSLQLKEIARTLVH